MTTPKHLTMTSCHQFVILCLIFRFLIDLEQFVCDSLEEGTIFWFELLSFTLNGL